MSRIVWKAGRKEYDHWSICMKHNRGIKMTQTEDQREFVAQFKPKKYKDILEWTEEFEKVRKERAGELTELVKYSMGITRWIMKNSQTIMELPDCSPQLFLKASGNCMRAVSELNALIQSLSRLQKDLGNKVVEEEAPTSLPPDFSDPPTSPG